MTLTNSGTTFLASEHCCCGSLLSLKEYKSLSVDIFKYLNFHFVCIIYILSSMISSSMKRLQGSKDQRETSLFSGLLEILPLVQYCVILFYSFFMLQKPDNRFKLKKSSMSRIHQNVDFFGLEEGLKLIIYIVLKKRA